MEVIMANNTQFDYVSELSEGYAIAKFAGENRWAVIDEMGNIADRFFDGSVEKATFQISIQHPNLANKVTFKPFKNGVSEVQVKGLDPVVGENDRRTLLLVSKSGFMRAFAYDNEADRDWWFGYLGKYFDKTTSFLARTPSHLKSLAQLGFYSDIAQHGLLMRFEKLENLVNYSKVMTYRSQDDLENMNARIARDTLTLQKDASDVKEHYNYIFKALTSGYKKPQSNFRHKEPRVEPASIVEVKQSIDSALCGPSNVG